MPSALVRLKVSAGDGKFETGRRRGAESEFKKGVRLIFSCLPPQL